MKINLHKVKRHQARNKTTKYTESKVSWVLNSSGWWPELSLKHAIIQMLLGRAIARLYY